MKRHLAFQMILLSAVSLFTSPVTAAALVSSDDAYLLRGGCIGHNANCTSYYCGVTVDCEAPCIPIIMGCSEGKERQFVHDVLDHDGFYHYYLNFSPCGIVRYCFCRLDPLSETFHCIDGSQYDWQGVYQWCNF